MSESDQLFYKWYNYMLDNGHISPTINVQLMKIAFRAAYHAGFYDCLYSMSQIDCDTTCELPTEPFWYA